MWHSTRVTSGKPQTLPLPGPDDSLAPGLASATGLLYGLAIFASAFLLFEVEPLIAKIILPWFGGAAAVWTVCLLFFQVVLLLGYVYAHLLARRPPPRAQGRIHAALLVVSLLALRILPRDSSKPAGPEHPAILILLLLCVTVGLPYFVLSTTSPLLQSWYVRSRAGAEPYRFYALSNAGSMLALVSYPVLIEPFISNSHQAFAWEIAYGSVALLCGAIALFFYGEVQRDKRERNADDAGRCAPNQLTAETSNAQREAPPDWKLKTVWVALAACGSALLLSVTNHISQNIASVPFLWILPLSLYLLSFILCFDARGWYRREVFLRMLGSRWGR